MSCKSIIKKIYTGLGIDKTRINDYIIANNHAKLKKEIVHFYEGKQVSREEEDAINFLKNNSLTVYPYGFIRNYSPSEIAVCLDPTTGLQYVNHNNKKLFFPKDMPELEIKKYYSELLKEQDLNSPHRYLIDGFRVKKDDTVLDIGGAEGIFSLDIIELAKQVLIFEADEKWVEPLRATFEPWKDKVTIIHCYVSDLDSETSLTLDTYCKNFISDINFIKMDVEGYEARIIDGAKKVLTNNENIIVTICTYHRESDFENFSNLFQSLQYSIKPSQGFMIFYHDPLLKAPYFRRGLLRAIKTQTKTL